MARRKRRRGAGDGSDRPAQPVTSRDRQPKGERRVIVTGPVERPLKVARGARPWAAGHAMPPDRVITADDVPRVYDTIGDREKR